MEEHPYRDSIIRCASSSDIYALVNICRMAFPRNVRWQGFGSFARKWWEVAIMSSGAEALIIQVNDEVQALCVLAGFAIRIWNAPEYNPYSCWQDILEAGYHGGR